MESLVLTLKGHLFYETVIYHKVDPHAQLMNWSNTSSGSILEPGN